MGGVTAPSRGLLGRVVIGRMAKLAPSRGTSSAISRHA
jgi:hypothetical protein